jgi:hypothetical protein
MSDGAARQAGTGILATARQARRFDPAPHMAYVTAKGGPGALRQLVQLWRLTRRPWLFQVEEYYDYGLWRPELTREDLRAFVPLRRNRAANDSLRARSLGSWDPVIVDKLASAAHLAAHGLPSTPTLAFYAGDPAVVPRQDVPVLRDAASLRAFLADPAHYPLFGKPLAASWSNGAVNLAAVDAAADRGTLSNGVVVALSALVAEIVADWGSGYLFQPVLRNAAVLRPHLGTATASLRLVTVMTQDGPEILYAKLKLPAATAMHDGPSRNPRGGGLVDPATGRILVARRRFDPAGPALSHWQDQATPLTGLALPHFDTARSAVLAGHRLFPGHGILGWDVILTDHGPVLNEVNANPGHAVYQQVALRGLLNPDMLPLWERARAWARTAGGAAA